MDVRRILEYALEREREGLAFFTQHSQKAGHAAVAGVFRKLADEERGHIRYLEGLLAGAADAAAPSGPAAVVHDGSFFSDRAAAELIEQTTAEAMVPDLPVLRMAYLIERDLAEFYAEQAAGAAGPAGDAFARLAAWEREHEALFKKLHDRVFAQYASMPWGG